AKASPAERKAIWREHLLQLRLFWEMREMLQRAGGPIDSDLVREILILNLPGVDHEKMFATFINWTRYGELFGYDETTQQLSTQGAGHTRFTLADTDDVRNGACRPC